MKIFLYSFLLAASLSVALMSNSAQAQLKKEKLLPPLETAAGQAFEKPVDLPTTIGNYIRIILTFLGVVALVLVVYAGFLWMSAGGNEEQVTKAKGILKNGVIGLVIVSLAYTITSFVISQISGQGGAGPAERRVPVEGEPGFIGPPRPPPEEDFFAQ